MSHHLHRLPRLLPCQITRCFRQWYWEATAAAMTRELVLREIHVQSNVHLEAHLGIRFMEVFVLMWFI